MDQQNPSIPGSASGESVNARPQPVIRALDEQGQPVEPAAGWGAPAQPGQQGQPASGWGAPQQYAGNGRPGGALKNWSTKKSLIVGGVAVVVVAAAAGAGAYAAGNGGTSDTGTAQGPGGQTGQTGQGGFGGPGGGTNMGPGGLGVGMGGLNAAIHGEYVVLQNSNYVTMTEQLGTVTDISGSSMTVKSEDGFTQSYALSSDVVVAEGRRQRGSTSSGTTLGISDVKSGATVRVTALKDSGKYTAQSILISTATTSTDPNSNSGTPSTPSPGTTN